MQLGDQSPIIVTRFCKTVNNKKRTKDDEI